MLKVRDCHGKQHLLCHFHKADIHALKMMQLRFNGEIAIVSALNREWVPIQLLDFSTAVEVYDDIVMRKEMSDVGKRER